MKGRPTTTPGTVVKPWKDSDSRVLLAVSQGNSRMRGPVYQKRMLGVALGRPCSQHEGLLVELPWTCEILLVAHML